MQGFFREALERHLGGVLTWIAGPTLLPVAYGFGIMLAFWIILFWMYRRKIFLRI